MSEAIWKVTPWNAGAEALAAECNVSPLVGQIALNRGIDTAAKFASFITPSLRNLIDPFKMHSMKQACERIKLAIEKKEKIVVYGDYDVDGITGTVTMVLALQMYGADVSWHIPLREEGYGLNSESLTKLMDVGAQLIISVDCGVTACEPAETVRARGVDLIITDHHEPKELLPKCHSIVHPRVHGWDGDPDSDMPAYGNPDICGSGVAYKVAWGLGKLMGDGERVPASDVAFFQNALGFTALGTIADVVPLYGENRCIAQVGLQRLTLGSCFDGIRALITAAHMDGKEVDGYGVGFMLAPRLNAAGRMGNAATAARMLLSNDYNAALAIAEGLETANQARQLEERKIVKDAEAQYEQQVRDCVPTDIIVVRAAHWHHGVVGIVSSRLSEKYHKPSIVLVEDGGSGRSVEGFSIMDAISTASDLMVRFGGHSAACGMKLHPGKLDEFRERICEYARKTMTADMRQPKVKIECEATFEAMTLKLVDQLGKVGPYGNGNRRPFFVFRDVKIIDTRRMGKEQQFLSLVGQQGDHTLKLITFKPTDAMFKIESGDMIDVVGEPSTNEWKGNVSIQIMVRDLRASDKRWCEEDHTEENPEKQLTLL